MYHISKIRVDKFLKSLLLRCGNWGFAKAAVSQKISPIKKGLQSAIRKFLIGNVMVKYHRCVLERGSYDLVKD